MASVMIRHLPTGLRALKSAMSPQISQDQRPLALVWRAWSAAAEQGGIESGQSGTEQPQAEAGSSATTLAEEGDGDSGQEVQGGAVPDPTEESTSTTSPEQPRMSSLSQEEEEEITAALDSEIKELKEANRLMNPAQLKAWVLQVQEEYHNAQQAQEASGEQEVHELNLDEPRTVSFAGIGRSGWRVMGYDEEQIATYWECDLIGGAVHENERNALLCDEVKELMYDWNKHWGWEVEDLANYFRIRQQRVMGIIALKELEHAEAERTGKPLDKEVQYALEGGPGLEEDGSDGYHGLWECDQVVGVGERHVKMLKRSPGLEYGNDLEVGQDEAMRGPDRRRQVPVDILEKVLEIQEDEQQVAEFKERLEFNMGKIGRQIQRKSRMKTAPQRPKEGFSLVVRELGKNKKGEDGKAPAYVARPDGRKRDLTASEKLYLDRQNPLPRQKYVITQEPMASS